MWKIDNLTSIHWLVTALGHSIWNTFIFQPPAAALLLEKSLTSHLRWKTPNFPLMPSLRVIWVASWPGFMARKTAFGPCLGWRTRLSLWVCKRWYNNQTNIRDVGNIFLIFSGNYLFSGYSISIHIIQI